MGILRTIGESMLRPVTFQVDTGSGMQRVTASHPDFVEYESRFDKPIVDGLQRGMISVWLFLVWHASRRQGITDLAYDEWLALGAVLEPDSAEEPPPLELEPQPGSLLDFP